MSTTTSPSNVTGNQDFLHLPQGDFLMTRILNFIYLLIFTLALSACSSSSNDDDSETDTTYFKIYNASPNAGTTYVYLDDVNVGVMNFATSYASYTLNDGDYELAVSRVNESAEITEVIEQEITLTNDMMSMYMLVGDYTAPELVLLEYDATTAEDLRLDEDEEGDEQFELYVAHLSADSPQYDVYLGSADDSFEQASLVTSLAYKNISDKQILVQDEYRLYLTQSGSDEVIFTSTEIDLSFLDTFVLVIRDNFGPSTLAVDRISGFSAVLSHLNEDSAGEVQFYQSDNSIDALDIYIGENSGEPLLTGLSSDSLSNKTSLEKGAYSFSMTTSGAPDELILKNVLLNINQGDVKTVIFYRDQDAVLQGISFDKRSRPLAYENAVTVVNLATEFEDIDVYFVRSDENLDTASKAIYKLDFAESSATNLVQQEYQIFVIHEHDNGTQQLLYQSPALTLDANVNYFLIVEPDENEFSGYSLNIIQE